MCRVYPYACIAWRILFIFDVYFLTSMGRRGTVPLAPCFGRIYFVRRTWGDCGIAFWLASPAHDLQLLTGHSSKRQRRLSRNTPSETAVFSHEGRNSFPQVEEFKVFLLSCDLLVTKKKQRSQTQSTTLSPCPTERRRKKPKSGVVLGNTAILKMK